MPRAIRGAPMRSHSTRFLPTSRPPHLARHLIIRRHGCYAATRGCWPSMMTSMPCAPHINSHAALFCARELITTRWPQTSARDRKSTRLNSSHDQISYAVFCLKKKKEDTIEPTRGNHRARDATTHPVVAIVENGPLADNGGPGLGVLMTPQVCIAPHGARVPHS